MSYLQKHRDLRKTSFPIDFWYFRVKLRQAQACLTWVLLRCDVVMSGESIRWVEGQMVSVSYSTSAPHLARLHLLFGNQMFAEHWWCFVDVCSLKRSTQQSVELASSKAIESSWMGDIVFKKKQKQKKTVLLIVIYLCDHLEKLSMWLCVIHMTNYHLATAVVESCIFESQVCWHCSDWMDKCVEILVLAGGWLEEKFKRWPHLQQHDYIAPFLPWSEAGISTWSAKKEHRHL